MATVDRASAQLVGLATRELELCRVQADESVLIYSDPDSPPELVGAMFAAANNLSDLTMEVVRPLIGARPGVGRRATLPGPLRELAESVDVLIDVSSRGMLHGGDIQNLLAAGTRILRVREPAPVLARLFPDERVTHRIAASGRLLERTHTLHFCSSTGTDLVVDRRDRPVLRQYGYCAQAGQWDHWGTALATFSPEEDAADGRLVLAPGDVFFLTAVIGVYVDEPVKLTVENGAIVAVEGGRDARRLESSLQDGGDPDARLISHVGWGGDPRAEWNALSLYARHGGGGADLRSYQGGVVIAFGSNTDMGGTNGTHFHMDLAFRSMSVSLDDREVLCNGQFNVDELR
jgi:2,5-dihydroxypyridine 5,6-dioxygenase